MSVCSPALRPGTWAEVIVLVEGGADDQGEEAGLAENPGLQMAAALAALAASGTPRSIHDPAAWQGEMRKDRALPDQGK